MDEKTKFVVEAILFGKEKAKVRRRIRRRVSYKDWKGLLQDLPRELRKKKGMDIWNFMNRKRAFGTATKAYYSLESLLLCVEDLNGEEK